MKPQQTSKKRKAISHNREQSVKFHLENQQHYLQQLEQQDLSTIHIPNDTTAKIRRSTRLKALSTRIFMIQERGESDCPDDISAEDINVPKNHH